MSKLVAGQTKYYLDQAEGRVDAGENDGGSFAAEDLIVIKRNEPRLDVSNGDRGRVLAVDPDQHRLLVESNDRPVELGARFLDDRTGHGDPTLVHATPSPATSPRA